MKLREYKNVHCIGIGGIGLSALARYCHTNGATVSGSDGSSSRLTHDLQQEGIVVYEGHDASHIDGGTDLVIYTIAISEANTELLEAKHQGITCMSYPEALGLLTKEYTTIAVCGTHGKTTTTAMVASMLSACGKSPTVIVGSILAEGGTNFIQGDSEYLVVEACEYRRSFLNLHPKHIIVTNIDEDHLDYYKDIADIYSAFQSFADKIKEGGFLVTHADVKLYTLGTHVRTDGIEKEGIELSVLGSHNKRNAELALALGRRLSLDEISMRTGLKNFKGTWRRLEYKGSTDKGVKVHDDYGHHPTEIKATLEALRLRYPKDKHSLHVFFQPHLYSRTRLLLDDFANAFSDADKIYISPIYAAREIDDGTVSHHDLVLKLQEQGRDVEGLDHAEDMQRLIEAIDDTEAIVLSSGAGNAYEIINRITFSK